jgi:hypothetical protein
MRLLKTEISRYAFLLILLFTIAAIAVYQTISHFEGRIPDAQHQLLMIMLWALSLGFMAIAGAFGLWGINISAEAESRRRVGRLVDAMDYIDDSMLLVDRRGRVIGSNPPARELSTIGLDREVAVTDAFPCLRENDVGLLLESGAPCEIERQRADSSESRTLRFRSLPTGKLSLLLISDVTTINEQRLHRRRAARLALVGQIAKGVADDFNELLFAIACSASVLPRLRPGSPELQKTVQTIAQNAEKGANLADHLQQLAGTSAPGLAARAAGDTVRKAADALRDSLSLDWTVEATIRDELPPVALTRSQLEQLVINLGLLAAEQAKNPGKLDIILSTPGRDHLSRVPANCAGALVVAAVDTLMTVEELESDGPEQAASATGVIQSVIRSMVEAPGGSLDCLHTPDGSLIYRVALPRGPVLAPQGEAVIVPEELRAYISQWNVLLAMPGRRLEDLEQELTECGVRVTTMSSIMKTLGHIDTECPLDAMILDERLLGDERKALLRAILKLRPRASIVVLSEAPEYCAPELQSEIVFLSDRSSPNQVIMGMIQARQLSVKRPAGG